MTTKLSHVSYWFSTLFRQLRLSISSINFYQDVFTLYKGYGIKYLFTVSSMSSLIYCIFIFNYLLDLKGYFVENRLSEDTTNVEYILKQLPEIHYDGSSIKVDQDAPIYLSDENGNKIVAIDSKNQLPYSEKIKIPILFSSNNVTIATVEISDKKKSVFSIEYSKIFPAGNDLINEAVLKKHFSKILSQAPRIFIYLIMPLIILVRFIAILCEKSFIILLIYILTSFLGPKCLIQTCSRMVLFSSGVPILLQPLIIMFIPELSGIIFFVQMIANLLLFLALLKMRNSRLRA